ncbi:hypothetical protein BC835DRAFT_1311815, partial [Cytidiella melzeri]
MPPKRKHDEPDACSNRSGRLQKIRRKHMSDHLKTEKHVTAQIWQSERNVTVTAPVVSVTVGPAAILSCTADIQPHRTHPSVTRMCSESPLSVLQEMDIDSHGLYQDVGGQSICFTAGEDLEQISAQVLHQQIEDLGYYSHECLADFWSSSEGAEGLFDGEDATLSNVATALEAMGKFFA